MKIRIEIENNLNEEEIVIRCRELNRMVQDIQTVISEKISNIPNVVFYKDKEEYFFQLSEILFFETDNDMVYAHTASDIYRTDYKLYELLKFLPYEFVRISKSAIVNTMHILSISRNLASSSLIRFYKSHKQIYVSRLYYKDLKEKLTSRS